MRRGFQTAVHSGGASLGLFTEADLEDIHLGTLELLDQTGVLVESDEACDVFADGGCRVNRETHIVKIPPEVVADALHSARRRFTLFARDPEKDLLIEPGRVAVGPFAEGLMVNDLHTGEHRVSTKKDVGTIARLIDGLGEIDMNNVTVTPRDVSADTAELHGLQEVFSNTTKPVVCGMPSKRQVELGADMAAAIVGGHDKLRERPILAFCGCPVAPLNLCKDWAEGVVATARVGLPVCCCSMGMAGGSTPITLVGTLIVQNAEELSTLTLTQLVNRGNTFVYASSTCSLDMRFGTATVGTPETALYQAGTAALADYYSVPSWTAGY
jgi:trimethylamine---corrinoid protein Co-methyltransferase